MGVCLCNVALGHGEDKISILSGYEKESSCSIRSSDPVLDIRISVCRFTLIDFCVSFLL